MKSALEYLGKSLTNSLSYSSEVLFEVGETKSMSSFELEMTSWAELKRYSPFSVSTKPLA